MKLGLSKTILILSILLTGTNATAEIFRCEGRSAPTGELPNSKITFDIVMPVTFDSHLSILDRETKKLEHFGDRTGHGIIEIIKIFPKAERYPFIVTRKPSAVNHMYGFFVEGGIPVVIHIDTWKKEKIFSLYDAFYFPGSVVVGTCR